MKLPRMDTDRSEFIRAASSGFGRGRFFFASCSQHYPECACFTRSAIAKLGTMTCDSAAPAVLEAYLLGCVDFESLLNLQRRLVYEIGGERSRGVLILCEFPHLISVGREGSNAHIHYEPDELWARGWPVRWVNRGGGCLLHGPGQLAVIPVMALDRLKLDLPGYLKALHEVLLTACREADAQAVVRPDQSGIFAKDRLLAHVG